MTEETTAEQNRGIRLFKRDAGPRMLERSSALLTHLISQLEQDGDFSHLRPLPIRYTKSFAASLTEYPHQIAAVVELFQPDYGTAIQGFLDSESHVIVTKRARTNNWGAETWAVPMGKIESKDAGFNITLGNAIHRASRREVLEEVVKENTGGFLCIANSFLDEATGNLIHVVVDELGSLPPKDGVLTVSLPDLREHSDIRWIQIKDIPTLQPIKDGSKFVFLTALKFIQEQNKVSTASNRYK